MNSNSSSSDVGSSSPLNAFIICHAIALLGLVTAILPFVFDGIEKTIGDASFAMVLVGGFFSVTAFLSSFVFLHRLGVYRELFQEGRLLAHWRYSESEWRAFSDAELATETSVKKMLVMITAAFALMYCGLIALLHPELATVMIGVALAIIALMAGTAALSSLLSRQRNLTTTGEARIGRRGLWMNGALHVWSGGGCSLMDCGLDDTTDPKCLVFSYTVIERHGPQMHQTRVPVPHDQIAKAAQVITRLQPDFNSTANRGSRLP